MNATYTALILLAALTAGGCETAPPADGASRAQAEVPARIVDPTEESRAELERVVSDMLFGTDVVLGDDALTEASVLVLERGPARSMESPPLNGRAMRKPERFQLVTDGERCFLIHGDGRARYELVDTECVAEE